MRSSSSSSDFRLLLAYMLGFVVMAALRPAASYKVLELGGSAVELGLVGGAFGILSMLVALPIGMRVDRVGDRPFFVAGTALLLVSAVIELFADSIALLVVGQAVLGLGQVAASVAIQARTANLAPPPSSDQRFARLSVANSIGQLAGPLLAGIAIGANTGAGGRETGIALAFGLSIVVGGIALVVALLPVEQPAPRIGARPAVIKGAAVVDLLRRPGALPSLAASVAVAATVDVLIAYLPLLGEENRLAPAFIGTLLAIRSGSGLLSRLLLTPMLRYLGRQRLLAAAMLMAGIGVLAVALVPIEPILVVLMFLVGFGLGVGQPLTQSWAADMADQGSRGLALSLRVAANRVAQLVIPSALGVVGLATGFLGIFVVGAGMLVVSAALVERFVEPATLPTTEGIEALVES